MAEHLLDHFQVRHLEKIGRRRVPQIMQMEVCHASLGAGAALSAVDPAVGHRTVLMDEDAFGQPG